jgi:hypothetical protein
MKHFSNMGKQHSNIRTFYPQSRKFNYQDCKKKMKDANILQYRYAQQQHLDKIKNNQNVSGPEPQFTEETTTDTVLMQYFQTLSGSPMLCTGSTNSTGSVAPL